MRNSLERFEAMRAVLGDSLTLTPAELTRIPLDAGLRATVTQYSELYAGKKIRQEVLMERSDLHVHVPTVQLLPEVVISWRSTGYDVRVSLRNGTIGVDMPVQLPMSLHTVVVALSGRGTRTVSKEAADKGLEYLILSKFPTYIVQMYMKEVGLT